MCDFFTLIASVCFSTELYPCVRLMYHRTVLRFFFLSSPSSWRQLKEGVFPSLMSTHIEVSPYHDVSLQRGVSPYHDFNLQQGLSSFHDVISQFVRLTLLLVEGDVTIPPLAAILNLFATHGWPNSRMWT